MDSLENSDVFTDVGCGNNSEAADEACTEIADDIAVEVFEEKNVELIGIFDQLHAKVVHDDFVVFNIRVIGGDSAAAVEEQTVTQFHDVGFMHGGDKLAVVVFGIFESEAGNGGGGFFGDDLQAFHYTGYHDVLEAGVQVFRIFADDYQIDIFVACFEGGNAFGWPEVCVEVQFFTQGYVDACEALADGRCYGAFQGNAVSDDRCEDVLREGSSVLNGNGAAGFDMVPVDFYAGGVDDFYRGGSNFGADTVTGYESDVVCFFAHGFQIQAFRLTSPRTGILVVSVV